MEPMTWLALAIFAVTIVVVITGWIDSTVAALLGVAVMVWLGVMTEEDAFGRLRKASQVSGRPLRVIAEAVIATLGTSD